MKKAAAVLVAFLLILSAGIAEVYLDMEAPEEWNSRSDILRLTAFRTLINDCTLLEVGGKSMLIDGGVSKWHKSVASALAELGYDGHVDVFFNTHPHDDHLEAMLYMIRAGFTADEFWSSFPTDYGLDICRETVRELRKAGIPYHQLEEFETVDFGGATLVFYWWAGGNEPNSKSALMHITFGNSTVLMSADMSGRAAESLVQTVPPEYLKADILKYPHHGITPARADFMDAVDPSVVFVSNRKVNIPKTAEQLEYRNIPCYHTTAGRVVMVTDGSDWYIMQYKDEF